MPIVRIDDEVARKLAELAKALPPFWSRNQVLRAALGMETGRDHSRDQGRRKGIARFVFRTPICQFEVPILRALVDSGGKARANIVLKRVGSQMHRVLKDEDRQTLGNNGELRWHNSAKIARKNLIKDGYLARDSEYGFWEITTAGREHLKEREATPPF